MNINITVTEKYTLQGLLRLEIREDFKKRNLFKHNKSVQLISRMELKKLITLLRKLKDS